MKKPYVVVNCAMSADGKIALPTKKQMRLSSEEDIERMYKLRNECDAVLVGIDTVLLDNPKLTVKEKYIINPKQPLRVVLDSKCRTPKDALVLNDSANTLIITSKGNLPLKKLKTEKHHWYFEGECNYDMLNIIFSISLEGGLKLREGSNEHYVVLDDFKHKIKKKQGEKVIEFSGFLLKSLKYIQYPY